MKFEITIKKENMKEITETSSKFLLYFIKTLYDSIVLH